MPNYKFSSEYYRALARLVLDLKFRASFFNSNKKNKGKMLRDGGFGLTKTDIKAITNIPKTVKIKMLIGEINGKVLYKTITSEYKPPTQVKPVDVIPS
jgi:hypothetical protein